jgi:hypothetical protein
MYNGYESQDAFHEALQAAWAEDIANGWEPLPGSECDHAYGICDNTH